MYRHLSVPSRNVPSRTVFNHTVTCRTVSYHAVPYHPVQCRTVPGTILYYTVPNCAMGMDSTFLKSCAIQYLSLKWWREECKGSPALPASPNCGWRGPSLFKSRAALHRHEASLHMIIHFMITNKQISVWSSRLRYPTGTCLLLSLNYKNLFFIGHWKKEQNPDPDPDTKSSVWIRGSGFGSVSKCHGFGTVHYSYGTILKRRTLQLVHESLVGV